MKKIFVLLAFIFSPLSYAVNEWDMGDLDVFVGYNVGTGGFGKVGGLDDADWQFYHSFSIGARNEMFRGMFEYSPTTKMKTSDGTNYDLQQSLFSFDYLAPIGKNPNFNTKLNVGIVAGGNTISAIQTGTLLGGQIGIIQELKKIDMSFNLRYLDQITGSNVAPSFDNYNTWQFIWGFAYIF